MTAQIHFFVDLMNKCRKTLAWVILQFEWQFDLIKRMLDQPEEIPLESEEFDSVKEINWLNSYQQQ